MKHSKLNKVVPVLITWDVDPDPWIELENRLKALNAAIDVCYEHSIQATFFITAEPAHLYATELSKMLVQGHEVGCHGWTHGDEEDYDQMPETRQREYIEKATTKLQGLINRPIHSFRSPRVKTSAITLRLLAEYGYYTDSTVCSQRLDIISSNLINPQWLFAPRRPYRPHLDNPYRAGVGSLWEVPVSALGLPFISSTQRVVGVQVMKLFFQLFYLESKLTGKPIVYLAHPTEFRNRKTTGESRFQEFVKLKYFSPTFIRTHGFRPRNLLYRVNGDTLLESTKALFGYMASFPDVLFLTATEYAQQYLENRDS